MIVHAFCNFVRQRFDFSVSKLFSNRFPAFTSGFLFLPFSFLIGT